MTEHFGDLLNIYVQREQETPGRLATKTDIPKKTIASWIEGRVKRPRNPLDIVRLAAALHLHEAEADRLLQTAGQPSLAELTEKAQASQDEAWLSILAHWAWPARVDGDNAPDIAAPFQVPAHITDFVGRQSLLQEVTNVILAGGRICVLRGMAGVGKTTIARQLAYDLRNSFPDGVLWAELAGARQANQVDETYLMTILGSFARAYGLDVSQVTDLNSRSVAVRDLLAGKRALLVLNDALGSEDVRPLLPASTSPCSVIITSRNRKMLYDQAISFAVAPFAAAESLALLGRVAGQARIEAEAGAARQIIALLGHLPLALKIVASDLAQTPEVTLSEYHQLLQNERDRLDSLADWEDASKDVRASFEASFRRLPEKLQQLFTALSVFGSFDFSLEAAAAVAEIALIPLKKAVGQLHSLSLVEIGSTTQDNEAGSQAAVDRYHLHGLLHLFAREKLAQRGDSSLPLARRAAIFFVNLVEQNKAQPNYENIDVEWRHVRQSLDWAQQKERADLVTKGLDALTTPDLGLLGYADARGYWREAGRWLGWVQERGETAEGSLAQAANLLKQGAFAFRLAERTQAQERLQRSHQLLSQLPEGQAVILYQAYLAEFMARFYLNRDNETALDWLDQGLAGLEKLETELGQQYKGYLLIVSAMILGQMMGLLPAARTRVEAGLALLPERPTAAKLNGLLILSVINALQGDLKGSNVLAQEGLGVAEAIGDSRRLATLRKNMGINLQKAGDLPTAMENYQIAAQTFKRMGDSSEYARTLINIGMATIILGEDEQAVATLQQALELARTRELTDLAALAQITLAFPLLRQGRWDKAWEQLQQGHQTCIESQLAYLLPSALYWQAELARLEGRYEAGLALVEQALAVAHQGNFLQEEGIAWSIKGKLLDDMAHFAEAERAHRQSLAKLAEQDRYELARATLALGQHFIHKTGCPPHEAKSLLQEALAIFEQLGAGKDADLAKSLLL